MNAVRLDANPIIRPDMLDGDDGRNINGPSLIRAPDWLDRRLGRYYLYFAHHGGRYIRLARADDLAGPWTIHAGGTLQLDQAPCSLHIASPDVHVDHDERQIRMYYHGVIVDAAGAPIAQRSFVATSADGLTFECRGQDLGPSYLRAFRWGGAWYGSFGSGRFGRSADGFEPFEMGPRLLQTQSDRIRPRHTAVQVRGDELWVLFSRIGDEPERILLSRIQSTDDWRDWTASEPVTVLEPRTDWEGADLPAEPSLSAAAPGPVRQLRDPAIYSEDGRTYLLYSVAGESGVAIAELRQ